MSSLRAAILDCLGADPDEAPRSRPSVAEALASCPRGEVRPACRGGQDVAIAVLSDGRGVLVADRCPHDGGPLSDGFLDGGRLVCARHGWEFDLATGTATGRPGRCVEVLGPVAAAETRGISLDC